MLCILYGAHSVACIVLYVYIPLFLAGNAWSAMLRFAMLAEQGCAVAVENMAWLAERVLPVPPIDPLAPEEGCTTPPSWWDIQNESNSSPKGSQKSSTVEESAINGLDDEHIDGAQQLNKEEDGENAAGPEATAACTSTSVDAADAGHCSASAPLPQQHQGPVRRKLPQTYRVPAFWTARGLKARWWQRVLAWRLRAAQMDLLEGWIDAGHMLCRGSQLGLTGGACIDFR